jgi:hypothetical protein
LLERAHHALASNPGLALALADEHAQGFSTSTLEQERELIAVSALVELGRAAEARRRARQFVHDHPTSAYAGRIERMVGLGE